MVEYIKKQFNRLRALLIHRPLLRKALIITLISLLFIIILPFLFVGVVSLGWFGTIPEDEDLQNIHNSIATEIYSADSVLLGKYYYQNRTNTEFEEINPYLIDALVATEDARFYKHEGIDFRSWARVLFKTILLGNREAGGGSTISQQLVKNLYGRQDEWIGTTKAKEALIARRIEDIYTKQEILTLYFNTVPFGDNIYGVETAAKRYFNKSAKTINLQEAATLIGMLKANYDYNPRVNPDKSRQRRNVVLNQLEKYGYINSSVADSVQQLPLETDLRIITTNTGLATYFREHLRHELEEWIAMNPKEDGSFHNLYSDGLKIYTTIDSKMQRYAEKAVKERMKQLQMEFDDHWSQFKPWNNNENILAEAVKRTPLYKTLTKEGKDHTEIRKAFAEKRTMEIFTHEGLKKKSISVLDSIKHHLMVLHTGMMALDPKKGYVKVWVGGIDHEVFKYDHVNKDTKRQVGSTFKPFVYTAALEEGFDPCAHIDSKLETYDQDGQEWTPRNSSGGYDLKYSFAGALMNSVNTVSVKLIQASGVEKTIKMAQSMGIESPIPSVPSIALGTNSASLYEMVTAYATFANYGKPVDPIYITSISNQHDRVLATFLPDVNKPTVIEEKTAEMVIEMMRAVVNNGTASRLRWKYKVNNDLAGKTGTTQNNADGWFIGFNPRLVVGVWVGANDPRIRFRSTSLGQGSNTALPIFASFYQQINNDSRFSSIAQTTFRSTSEEVRQKLDCAPSIENEPSLWEMIFGEKKEKELTEKKEEKNRKGIFKSIGDLFRRKNKDGN